MGARYLGQAMVHALVAALVVELLIRAWKVEEPRLRQRLRLLVLAAPLCLLPLLELLPVRREEWFEERWALLSDRHWAELTIGGVATGSLFLGALAALGGALFLADLIPFLHHRLRRRPRPQARGDAGAEAELARLADSLGVPAPRLRVLESARPSLLCRGVRAPELIVSRGTLALLDPEELRAALAHELAHLRARDTLWSWLLMAARALQAFNPVVQVVVRAVARDAERRADDAACASGQGRLALASAIIKLFRSAHPGAEAGLAGFLARARARAIEERCRRLLDGAAPASAPLALARLWMTGASLAGLLFFVV